VQLPATSPILGVKNPVRLEDRILLTRSAVTSSQCRTDRSGPIELVVALATALVVTSCAGSPAAPSDTPSSPVAAAPPVAAPPAGVSAESWRTFFVSSGSQAVKVSANRVDLFLPAEMKGAARAAFVADVAWASGIGIPARIVDSEAAANFVVTLVPGASEFDCGGNLGVACTIVEYSLAGGLVSGGAMRFNSVGLERQRTRRHEILHAFGILGHSPLPGLMSLPSQQPELVGEEAIAFPAWMALARLTAYSVG